MIDNERIGRALRTLRKKAGYTQKELADKLFVSKMAISKWETGKNIPDIDTLKKLSVILDMDVDGLIDGSATYLDDPWKGILFIDNRKKVDISDIICDKPMIDYLISYFLLAGVRYLLIICQKQDQDYIENRFMGGKKIGVTIRYNRFKYLDLYSLYIAERNWLNNSNIMLISDPFFIYGVDLTRFIQRAMQPINLVVNVKNVTGNYNTLSENYETNYDKLLNYVYQPIPLYFIKLDAITKFGKTENFEKFIREMTAKNQISSVALDKGFIYSSFDDGVDTQKVQMLVQLIQEMCMYKIYCPLEIAWRRDLLSIDDMKREASFFDEYNEYLDGLYKQGL